MALSLGDSKFNIEWKDEMCIFARNANANQTTIADYELRINLFHNSVSIILLSFAFGRPFFHSSCYIGDFRQLCFMPFCHPSLILVVCYTSLSTNTHTLTSSSFSLILILCPFSLTSELTNTSSMTLDILWDIVVEAISRISGCIYSAYQWRVDA